MKKGFKGTCAFKTDIGRVRISNEDQATVKINSLGEVFLIVCDGMGGQNKGDFASKMGIDSLLDSFLAKSNSLPTFAYKWWLGKAIKKANSIIYGEADKNPTYSGMGTTLVCALLSKDKLFLANVGDSRAYWLQKDKLVRLSQDQTYVDFLYRSGKISEAETLSHPDRHMLMNALGIYPSASYDLRVLPYAGESVMLCSDGLYNNVPETEIRAVLSTDERSDQKVFSLINEANHNGGSDNIAIALFEALSHD